MTPLQVKQESSIASFDQAQTIRDNLVWNKLESLTVEHLLNEWFAGLSERTKMNYQSGIRMLAGIAILNPSASLQSFSLMNHDAVIDRIKLLPYLSEATKQARAALYISFTRYLSRRFPGVFKKATPCREGTAKTFFRVHEKVTTNAMNQAQWTSFLSELKKINSRDCLIAKIVLQGGKRIREVLNLTTDQINWELSEITFKQSKTKGVNKETIITYPSSVMQELKEYLAAKKDFITPYNKEAKKDFINPHNKDIAKDFVFTSSRGNNPVILNQVANTFAKAGAAAGIPFKVTPHVLRASTVTYLKQQGFQDSDIMKITGHASSEMVNAYDKTSRADNASKKVSLV